METQDLLIAPLHDLKGHIDIFASHAILLFVKIRRKKGDHRRTLNCQGCPHEIFVRAACPQLMHHGELSSPVNEF